MNASGDDTSRNDTSGNENSASESRPVRENQIIEDRLVELESKLAYQEDLLETLNDIIAKQQSVMDIMVLRLDKVEEYLKSALANNQLSEMGTEELPPHY